MFVCGLPVAVKERIRESPSGGGGGGCGGGFCVRWLFGEASCSNKNPLPKNRKTSNKLFEKH